MVKEMHSYVCPDIVKEYKKYDKTPAKYFRRYDGTHSKTKQPWTCDIGFERFLGPEIFFNPEIFSSDFTVPLPAVVDESILKCPIDVRRGLYKNIVLSGGTSMFKDFGRRLQRDIKRSVDARMLQNITRLQSMPNMAAASKPPPEIEVNVVSHH